MPYGVGTGKASGWGVERNNTMKTKYIIDHESYGVRSEFGSLPEAELAMKQCGSDWLQTRFVERSNRAGNQMEIIDERGRTVGWVEEMA